MALAGLALLGLQACGGDPQMERLAQALADYDRGQALLAQHDWPAAARAFEAAAAAHPESPALHGWHAHALAGGGDVAGARAVLDAVIPAFPGNVDLRYNRAAYAARAGELEAAAADLTYLYNRDLLDPLAAGEDADFSAMARDPRFSSLAPSPQVRLQVRGEAGAILLGERFTAEMLIESKSGEPISAENIGALSSRLRHTRTVEDLTIEEGGWSRRVVRVEWLAAAAGEESMGPWLVSAHGTSAISDRLPVSIIALPGRDGGEAEASAPGLLLPSQLFAQQQPPHGLRLSDGRVAVMHAVEVSAEADAVEAGTLEYRIGGQTQWLVSLFETDAPLEVTLSSGESLTVP